MHFIIIVFTRNSNRVQCRASMSARAFASAREELDLCNREREQNQLSLREARARRGRCEPPRQSTKLHSHPRRRRLSQTSARPSPPPAPTWLRLLLLGLLAAGLGCCWSALFLRHFPRTPSRTGGEPPDQSSLLFPDSAQTPRRAPPVEPEEVEKIYALYEPSEHEYQ